MYGFDIGNNGTRLYITNGDGVANNNLYRTYQFNISEAWNISTAKLVTSFKHYKLTIDTEAVTKGIHFKPDGTQFSLVGRTSTKVVTYKLKTPWEIDSAYFEGSDRLYDENTLRYIPSNKTGYFTFANGGRTLFVLEAGNYYLRQWNLEYPYDLSSKTALADNVNERVFINNWNAKYFYGLTKKSIEISSDGSKLYLVGYGSFFGGVYEFKLSDNENVKFKSNIEAQDINASVIESAYLYSGNADIKGNIEFNGDIVNSDNDEYQTTLRFETQTENRTISFPNKSGVLGIVPFGENRVIYNSIYRLQSSPKFTFEPTYGSLGISGSNTTTDEHPTLNLSQTWDNASGVFTAVKLNIVDTNSDASSKLLDLQVDGTTIFDVYKSGGITLNAGYLIANLPASPVVGQIVKVTDGDVGIGFGAAPINSGSGATPYLCWGNGTAWSIIGA